MLIGLLFVLLAADVRYEHGRGPGLFAASPGARGAGGGGAPGQRLALHPGLRSQRARSGSSSAGSRRAGSWPPPSRRSRRSVSSARRLSRAASGCGRCVFLTIAGTVVLAGLTARPVGTWLGVRLPGARRRRDPGREEPGHRARPRRSGPATAGRLHRLEPAELSSRRGGGLLWCSATRSGAHHAAGALRGDPRGHRPHREQDAERVFTVARPISSPCRRA